MKDFLDLMSEKYIEQQINRTIAIGQNNASILADVRNWCRHLKVDASMAGMVAQMYRLPTRIRLSCPNAKGFIEGMTLDSMARDYVLQTCNGCKFHSPVFSPNFGTKVLDQAIVEKNEVTRRENEERVLKELLTARIKGLIKDRKKRMSPSALSILNLSLDLDDSNTRPVALNRLLEAAKLEPSFFDEVTLEILSLHFDDAQLGAAALEAVALVMPVIQKYPEGCFSRAQNALLSHGLHVNEVCLALRFFISKENLNEQHNLIDLVLDSVQYKPYFLRTGPASSYQGVALFLSHVAEQDSRFFDQVIETHLTQQNRHRVYHIIQLLQEVFKVRPQDVSRSFVRIVKTFDLETDDGVGDSAYYTCELLAIIVSTSVGYLDRFKFEFSTLSESGKIASLNLHKIFVTNDQYKQLPQASLLASDLIALAQPSVTAGEVTERAMDLLASVTYNSGTFFLPLYDQLLFLISQTIKAEDKFLYYKKELEKPIDQRTTFNPLSKLSGHEVFSMELKVSALLRHATEATQQVFRENLEGCFDKTAKVLKNLRSGTDAAFKCKIIEVIAGGSEDPGRLSMIIPDLYNYLMDVESKQVRLTAFKLFDTILTRFPLIIPTTLLDLLDIFLDDIDVSIRSRALILVKEIVDHFPSRITPRHFQAVLKSLHDNHVVIHKNAAKVTYALSKMLTEAECAQLFIAIAQIESAYHLKEDEREFGEDLADIMLHLSERQPRYIKYVVEMVLIPYCSCGNVRYEKRFLQKFARVRAKFPEFTIQYLNESLALLERSQRDIYNGSMDDRNKVYEEMYELPTSAFTGPTLIKKAARAIVKRDPFDGLQMLAVLAFHERFDMVKELTEMALNDLENNESNRGIRSQYDLCDKRASLELMIRSGTTNPDLLK